jgi:hypothetical protein
MPVAGRDASLPSPPHRAFASLPKKCITLLQYSLSSFPPPGGENIPCMREG